MFRETTPRVLHLDALVLQCMVLNSVVWVMKVIDSVYACIIYTRCTWSGDCAWVNIVRVTATAEDSEVLRDCGE